MIVGIAPAMAAIRVGTLGGAHSLAGMLSLACAGVFGKRGRWVARDHAKKDVPPPDGAAEWPHIVGSVASSRLVWNHVEISYQFTLEGKPFQGKHEIRLTPANPEDLYPELARRQEVQALLNRYPRGTYVTVRYDPAQPEQSLLHSDETQAKGANA